MRALETFGSEHRDQAKGELLAKRVGAADAKLAGDAGFLGRIELDPASALAELEFSAASASTFRVLPGVTTRDSCSCACFPTSCGTGVGCFNTDGHGSSAGTPC